MEHAGVLSHIAEYRIFDAVARAARGRGSAIAVVTDDGSFAAICAEFERVARTGNLDPPTVVTLGDFVVGTAGTVVAASMTAEGELFDAINTKLGADDKTKVYRMWADILVNKIAHHFAVEEPNRRQLFVETQSPTTDEISRISPYAIVCTPRTGSTYLADMLMRVGSAGQPREHLRPGPLLLAETGDFDLARCAEIVAVAGASNNGVFGTKLIAEFMERCATLQRSGRTRFNTDTIERARIVRLRRTDLIAQALSLVVARESKVFFERNAEKKQQREQFLAEYTYDFEPLRRQLNAIVKLERDLDALIAESGLPVLDVDYETLVADPTDTVRSVGRFLGLDNADSLSPKSKVQKLDDSQTRHIYDRFKADAVAADLVTDSPPAGPGPSKLPTQATGQGERLPSLDKTRELRQSMTTDLAIGPYQLVDQDVVDYRYTKIDGVPNVWRGPIPSALDRPGSFFCALGAAQTLGRFCRDPYVDLTAQRHGLPGLNLGFSGAGPSFFLQRPAVLEVVNRSRFAIVQVMSGRSEGNSLMRCDSGRNLVTWLPTGEECFTEEAFRHLLDDYPKRKIKAIVRETLDRWSEHMVELLDAVEVPTILLWMSSRKPFYIRRYDGTVRALMGAFPHLVDRRSLKPVVAAADHFVDAHSGRGLPHELTSRHSGEPVAVTFPNGEVRGEDVSYPSPEMHADAAEALDPVVREVLSSTTRRA